MIQTEQTVVVDRPIESVWNYVKDIERWANMMPGLQACAIINDNDSQWTLKVGVGGLVRTVHVLVHVDQWDGPERVNFSYKLKGDPVQGGGSYRASSRGADETEVTLTVQVAGSGPMAPMWEAMGRPLLPQFAKAFANQLKADIEQALGGAASPSAAGVKRSLLARLRDKWLAVWRSLFGPRTDGEERMS